MRSNPYQLDALSIPSKWKSQLKNLLLLTLLVVTIKPAICFGDDWPQWMGPKLDGISTESGWSSDWPSGGLEQLWEKQIGIGFSSVSIVDGLLYSMGHKNRKETVWCLDAATGKEIWTHSYSAELNANLYEGGPGATPTVNGPFVYTLSIDGQMLCLDRKTGKVIWQRRLQKDLGVSLHEWGFDSSPFIDGDRLYVQGGRVAAYDKSDGSLLWKSARHKAGYGAVRSFDHDGRKLLASLDCDGLRITASSDGSEVSFYPWKSPFRTNSTTPIIVKNQIYISTGYNVGCGLFDFDGSRLSPVYTSKRMRNHFNNSILYQGHVYGVDGNSNLGRVVTLTCMDFATGEVKWKQRGLGCGSLMIANGHLLILSEKGDLVLAKADPDEFQEIARSKFLSGRCWTVPVICDGKVFGRNASGKLVCVQLPSVD